ncbi:hypothetical protein VPH35_134672 [Triticum aestivum]
MCLFFIDVCSLCRIIGIGMTPVIKYPQLVSYSGSNRALGRWHVMKHNGRPAPSRRSPAGKALPAPSSPFRRRRRLGGTDQPGPAEEAKVTVSDVQSGGCAIHSRSLR